MLQQIRELYIKIKTERIMDMWPRTSIILQEPVRAKIRDKASAEEIHRMLHSQYDENMPSDYVLLCYAIFYHHHELMRECIASVRDPTTPLTTLKPYVIAIEGRNTEAIDLLLANEEPVQLTGYSLREEEGQRWFMNGSFTLCNSMTTMLKRDDAESFAKFLDLYEEERAMAHLALQYDAPRCFSVVTKHSHPSLTELDSDGKDLLLAAASSRLSLLQTVIDLGYNDCGQTDSNQQTSLHHCVSGSNFRKQRDSMTAHFIPEDTTQKIELLLSVGARPEAYDKDRQLAIDLLLSQPGQQIQTRNDIKPPYPLERHSKLVLECCELLLDNMKAEIGCHFRVPYRTFYILQANLQGILSKDVPAAHTSSRISCLTLVNDLSTMFLRYGVDLTANDQHLLLDACFLQCVTYTIKKLTGEMGKFVHEHIIKLLAYGATFTEKSCPGLQLILKEKPAYMDETVPTCISLMDHRTYQKFVESIKDQRRRVTETAEHGDHFDTELEIKDCRSLQQLCRLKLYEYVPNRNMAVYASQMPLPNALKSYLSLGIDL